MKRIFFLSLAFTTTASAVVAQSDLQPPPNIDAVVQNALSSFEVPGISIAIVKNGKVVLAKGYGVRQLGQPKSVDEHTLFPIASNTKAFTATALALLVQEGKIKWDDPVIDHLPWFRMSDPFVTANMTIRDLLVHRSGLPAYAGDLLQFPPTDYSREAIVRKLKDIPLAASFRSTYAYDNILYLAAGEVIKAVSGQSWEDFVQQRILDKVGMRESVLRFSKLKQQPNLATSHAPVNGKVQVLDNFFEQGFSDVSAPAGGIASNAVDMAQWMLVQLDSGRATNGNQVFKPSAIHELWKLVTPMPFGKAQDAVKPANMDFLGYALGFNVFNYRGVKVVAHGGKLDGFVSRMTLFPDLDLGIAVLTNQEGGGPYASITNTIADYYLNAPSFNWVEGYKKIAVANRDAILKKESGQAQLRNTQSSPSLPLSAYAGTYSDKWYGDVIISQENNKFSIRFAHSPQLAGELEHWQYNTFIARWKNRGLRADAYITFSLRADGSIEHATMKAISALTDPSHNFHDLLLKRK